MWLVPLKREREPQSPMTPGEYLASCELTKRLKMLGATDAQLEIDRSVLFLIVPTTPWQ
jgi:hypothetical protein